MYTCPSVETMNVVHVALASNSNRKMQIGPWCAHPPREYGVVSTGINAEARVTRLGVTHDTAMCFSFFFFGLRRALSMHAAALQLMHHGQHAVNMFRGLNF